jgi:NADPH:quinone reductase-like Zn-dependent oxidoreductase
MKAIHINGYGKSDVLNVLDGPKPEPQGNQVLIKIIASSVNAADWHIMMGKPKFARIGMGLFKPKWKVLGSDLSGIIESAGPEVEKFKVGDEVYANIFGAGLGAFQEFVCVSEDVINHKPNNLSFDEAAAIPLAGQTALQGIRDNCALKAGEHILIHGASGGVGTFAVQIAKDLGARVTAVCSTGKVSLAKALGADEVIDYKQTDFTKQGKKYDAILGVNGYLSLSDIQNCLNPNGRFALIGGTNKSYIEALLKMPLLPKKNGIKMNIVNMKATVQDLNQLTTMAEKGALKVVLDKTYPLEKVPKAIDYVFEGHATGKVVIHNQD